MTLKEITQKALSIRAKYAKLEQQEYGREWTGEELMLGFAKDVGDLAKIVMAKEGVRDVQDVDTALAHELSDCLWSIIVLADYYNVDLEDSFSKTMGELESRIQADLN